MTGSMTAVNLISRYGSGPFGSREEGIAAMYAMAGDLGDQVALVELVADSFRNPSAGLLCVIRSRFLDSFEHDLQPLGLAPVRLHEVDPAPYGLCGTYLDDLDPGDLIVPDADEPGDEDLVRYWEVGSPTAFTSAQRWALLAWQAAGTGFPTVYLTLTDAPVIRPECPPGPPITTFDARASGRLIVLSTLWRGTEFIGCPNDEQDTKPAPVRPARDAPCPCGSGQKHKRCHGASLLADILAPVLDDETGDQPTPLVTPFPA